MVPKQNDDVIHEFPDIPPQPLWVRDVSEILQKVVDGIVLEELVDEGRPSICLWGGRGGVGGWVEVEVWVGLGREESGRISNSKSK